MLGVGPTLHHIVPFAQTAQTFDLCDVLPASPAESERCLAAEADVSDWRPSVCHILACEGSAATHDGLARREALTLARVHRLLSADFWNTSALGRNASHDVVVSAFCAASVTDHLGMERPTRSGSQPLCGRAA